MVQTVLIQFKILSGNLFVLVPCSECSHIILLLACCYGEIIVMHKIFEYI